MNLNYKNPLYLNEMFPFLFPSLSSDISTSAKQTTGFGLSKTTSKHKDLKIKRLFYGIRIQKVWSLS